MIPLGSIAPEFILPDTRTGQLVSLQELKSDIATVIMFLCNHCPYVKHIEKQLVETALFYQKQGIHFIAISANDVLNYPQDGPLEMKLIAEKNNYSFPYLYDESQVVAKDYQAACTPDFFVFDKNLSCVYRGRFDDSTPGNNRPVSGQELKNALNHILANTPIDPNQQASMGCSIKWKKNA
jgi:thiol-disulfide isomerase/thioredoxin